MDSDSKSSSCRKGEGAHSPSPWEQPFLLHTYYLTLRTGEFDNAVKTESYGARPL